MTRAPIAVVRTLATLTILGVSILVLQGPSASPHKEGIISSHNATPQRTPIHAHDKRGESGAPSTQVTAEQKKIGYQTVTVEHTNHALAHNNAIPDWLNGTFYCNGPARFEVGQHAFDKWFNGFAMVHAITIANKEVTYSNKFIAGTYHAQAIKTGKLPASTQEKSSSFFSKMSSFMSTRPPYDNANVNVITLNKQIIACTETPHAFVIDPRTADTQCPFKYADSVESHVCTPHPITDPDTKEHINAMITFGKTSSYGVYTIAPNSSTRTVLATVNTDTPAYLHSFAATKKHIILIAQPLRTTGMELAFSTKPFLQNFSWYNQKVELIVIDRATKKQTIIPVDPFFFFHTVNAYENQANTIIDLITYTDATVLDNMKLSYLRTNVCSKPGTLSRITIDAAKQTASIKNLTAQQMETPKINELYRMKPYQWLYAVSADDSTLLKYSVTKNEMVHWHAHGCFVNEPTFVPKPNASREDDGVVLSMLLDTHKKHSALLILDGITFKEITRIPLPHCVPFGFHSTFIA
ncbi:MAG: carotenoid oxygenase family protein [Candidatus Babeliales bacterium]